MKIACKHHELLLQQQSIAINHYTTSFLTSLEIVPIKFYVCVFKRKQVQVISGLSKMTPLEMIGCILYTDLLFGGSA